MSRPGPHGREPRPYDWQRQFEQPDYGEPYRDPPRHRPPGPQRPPQPPYQQQPRPPYPQPHQQQPPRPPYPQPHQQPYRDQGYGDQGYGDQGYRDQGYEPYQPYQEEPYRQPAPPRRVPSHREPADYEPPSDTGGRGFRLPGLGLLLSLLGLVVQVLCLLVLPWLSASAAGGGSVSLPKLWDLATDVGADGFTEGFGGWYVVLLSYPLAALGVLLALVSVLEFVAGKVIFAGLAVIGLGWLLLRYGVGPAAGLFGEESGFSRPQIITTVSAAVALVVVIFMMRAGLAMFRRIGGVVLLIVAGVHIYAVRDLAGADGSLAIGAYGPALGYVLSGVAALVGPRRFSPG